MSKPSKNRDRLDSILVKRGLARSRERAKSLILAGKVLVNEVKVDKAGSPTRTDSQIRLLQEDHDYVSRGALKLLGALEHFHIDPAGFLAIDIGASSGGFCDVLLRRGAKKIYAVDVGYGILDWKIKSDKRIIPLERTNARYLDDESIPEKADIITMDVSFISIKKIIPNLINFLKPQGILLSLIKPQFEVGKQDVEKGGLVKDPQKHKRVLEEIEEFCMNKVHLKVIGTCPSKIKGSKGNKEFFIHAIKP